jgi:hypothetical protein
LHARYVIRTDVGALMRVDSRGLRHGPPEVMAALLQGERVDPAQVSFRTKIRLETSDPAHDALNWALFLTDGQRMPDQVLLRLPQV